MTNLVDTHIGQVVAELKSQKMWENTLLVISSDNGGPIYRDGAAGANNFPLRGGKKSNFEGGVRVNTLVSGGLLPASSHGVTTEALFGIEDWYSTFCRLAGVDPRDAAGEAAGLPPVDGLDLWPFLSGANATAPRTEVWLGSNGAGDSDTSTKPIVQALIRADGYKVLWGNVIEDAWTGPFYPNATTSWCDSCPHDCGTIDAPTCLFNVFTDPTELDTVAAAHPDIVAAMSRRLKELTKTVFAPVRGSPDTVAACKAGADGYVRPFLP
jgi:arylsulfatase I/J